MKTRGKHDAEEFEQDFNEILNLAIKALEKKPEDIISRAETIKYLNDNMVWLWYDGHGELADDEKLKAITDLINGVPSVTNAP